MTSNIHEKTALRKQLRAKRRALTLDEQALASFDLVHTIKPVLAKNRVKRIAMYLAADGEIDLQPLMGLCASSCIEVYLPVINRFKQTLWFAKYQTGDALYNNQFRIPEPLDGEIVKPWQLDWVLFPLVGFDAQGGRLGMGGGFYDRTFSQAGRWPKKPKLFGVAHECQRVESLPLDSWDIELDGVMTDHAFYRA